MKRALVFDLMNFLVAIVVFIFPVYFAYLGFPLEIQVLPSVFLVVPIITTLYRRRLEAEKIEKQETINRAKKLHTLSVKLYRIRDISKIASSLTYNKEFMDDETASLGWRRYFDRYGDKVDSDFGLCDYTIRYLVYGPASKQELSDFDSTIRQFYWVVRDYRHLYDDLAKMIELAGKIPKEQIKNLQELEENYEDFLNALRDLCDEDEEIGKEFEGKYPSRKPHKKISNIHS